MSLCKFNVTICDSLALAIPSMPSFSQYFSVKATVYLQSKQIPVLYVCPDKDIFEQNMKQHLGFQVIIV